MNLCLFFEGTGHDGEDGRATNVARLRDACIADAGQKLRLVPGAGTRFGSYLGGKLTGADWKLAFRTARRWYEANRSPGEVRTFLFGFSRGALLARHFAAWLGARGAEVAYMGLWDTVDSTAGLDVDEDCPPNVLAARHAVARDETRLFYRLVRLRGAKAKEMLFPGSHSDVGGLYGDNHAIADLALSWIAAGAKRAGLRLAKGAIPAQTLEGRDVVLHDPHGRASNMWGAFDRLRRDVSGIPLHRACRGV